MLMLASGVGCSTAPIAGALDCLFPSKVGAGSQHSLPHNPDTPNLEALPPNIYPGTTVTPRDRNPPRVELSDPIPAPSFPAPEL